MRWEKKGLIFSPDTSLDWQQHYGMLPTPYYDEANELLRVYFATSGEERFGRITFVDLDPLDPSRIISNPRIISLDIGEPGTFDDCGVNPSAIIRRDNQWMMYYAGYQRHVRTPYSILSGLAISDDGIHFRRVQETPILERTTKEKSLRSAPTVICEDGKFRMWYVADFGWKELNTPIFKNKLMPQYALKYGESADGIHWQTDPTAILEPTDDEFGFGRPYFYQKNGVSYLFYSVRKTQVTYRIGYSISHDGITWERKDSEIGIDVSAEGWDSQMVCYPAVIDIGDKTYLFYNGNNNGETGFGFAELTES